MKAQIRKLIEEGKLEQAIEKLLKLTEKLPDKDLYNEVIHHSSLYARFHKSERMRTESSDDLKISYARINQALISVLNQLPEDSPVASSFQDSSKEDKGISKLILLILAAIALMLLSYFAYKGFTDEAVVYKCKERVCIDCEDCYNSGCFKEAYRCLSALKSLTAEEEKFIDVSLAIQDGDQSLVDGQFLKAKEFYRRAIALDKSVEIHRMAAIEGIDNTTKADELLSAGRTEEARAIYSQNAQSDNSVIAKYSKMKLQEIDEREGTRRKPKKSGLKSILEGTWRQAKSGKAGEIGGNISFTYKPDAEMPSILYQNHFANGVIQKGELVYLTYASDKKTIKGVWHNFSTQQRGAFYFEVDTVQKDLRGKYSLGINEQPEYYWNGSKK